MRYNLHTHTCRCHHATGEDREYVEAAIQAGIKILGFADHCPQFFPDTNYYSHFRMRPEAAEEYVANLRKLQKEYEKDIRILVGFETEYYPKTYPKMIDFFSQLGLDYIIMGQHFIGNEYDDLTMYSSVERESKGLLKRYIFQVLEGLETGVFTYIAHPDIFNYKGDGEFYREQMGGFLRELKRLDIPVEYNLLGMKNGRNYPNPLFWELVAETGNRTVIGYDAHQPEALLDEGNYQRCLDRLRALGITPIDYDEIVLKQPKP